MEQAIAEKPKIIRIKMLKAAGSTGAVTNRFRSWTKNKIIEVPVGEFDHLGDGYFVVLGDVETASATPLMEIATGNPGGEINATQGAVELATAEGVNLADVEGTGQNGKIVKSDVEQYIQSLIG